jgi:uncharacterized protein YbjT (DUF2867 family)
LSRRPQRHRELLVLPGVTLVSANVHDRESLLGQFSGMDAVVNLVGVLNAHRKRGQGFREVHVELPRKVVEACREAGVPRLLHMSALHADAAHGSSDYLRSKGEGENVVHATGAAGLYATTFCPSVIFGPGDSFLNRFARLLRVVPYFFPLACPQARFAPVFVSDVVRAFAYSLERRSTFGKRYELCGPRVMSLREIVQHIADDLGLRRRVLGLSDRLSRWQARVMEWVPGRPFTYDNYLSLQVASVCRENALPQLGIEPTDLDAVIRRSLGQADLEAGYRVLRQRAGRS